MEEKSYTGGEEKKKKVNKNDRKVIENIQELSITLLSLFTWEDALAKVTGIPTTQIRIGKVRIVSAMREAGGSHDGLSC